jgi:hypothetical protein
MSDTRTIEERVNELPDGGVTVKMLHALDFVAPGQWTNTVNFDKLVRDVTNDPDEGFNFKVRVRALRHWEKSADGYQRAMFIFSAIETSDKALGAAALANLVGEKIAFLKFLDKITPKADKAQAIDLSLKLAAEIVGFCLINGIPGDSIGDFLKALKSYEKESIIRMAALVSVDGLIPLGPDFVQASLSTMEKLSSKDLESNSTYQRIKDFLPGAGVIGQIGFLNNGLGSVKDWISGFVKEHNLTPEMLSGRFSSFLSGADQKLDYLAGFLDVTTNYFEHTGTQSIARSLVTRAMMEM